MVVSTIIRTDDRYREKVGGDQIIIQGFTVSACCADDRRRQITFNMNVRRGCLRSIRAFLMSIFSMRDTSPVQRVIKTGTGNHFQAHAVQVKYPFGVKALASQGTPSGVKAYSTTFSLNKFCQF